MGIDPGANTGIAIYRAGELAELQTVEPHQLVEVIKTVAGITAAAWDLKTHEKDIEA